MPYLTRKNLKLQLSPGLVASYDIQPGNGVGLFWDKHTPDPDRERTQSVSSVQYFAHSFTTCQVFVKHTIASYDYQKSECVQQWNLFKWQTSTFYFSAYHPNLFEHLFIQAGQTIWEMWLLWSPHQSSKQHIG